MRKFGWLILLVVAVPFTCWASSSADIQSLRGKTHSGGDVFSARVSGSSMEGMNGRTFHSALTTGRFDGAVHQGGLAIEGKSGSGITLDGTRHKLGFEHSKGEDDGGGDDGGDIALPVPEPGTLSLLGAGLVGLAGVVRRRRSA